MGWNMLTINRNQIKRTFHEYTSHYDITDDKIRLKIGHTYRVADLCERIARSENMSEEEVNLAWLLGMLHDIGRFEQLKKYGTFMDAESVDHAMLGADLLFGIQGDGLIRDYVPEDEEDELIEKAVREHSVYRIADGLDVRTQKFCHILRDADKIDILKVNVDFPLEEIYNTTTEKLRSEEVTQEVLESYYKHQAVLRALKKTSVDHVVGHCSLIFELVFPESLKIVRQQDFIWKLLDFKTDNPVTAQQFQQMKKEMQNYLSV
jgi:HD superfamily phosphohydrolase YqeK